jgi:exopolyphosphatase
LNYVLTDFC